MRRTKIKTLTLGLLTSLGWLTGCNRVGDAYCDTDIAAGDSKYYEVCPFGNASEVKYKPDDTCPKIQRIQSTECDTISWWGDVWPTLQKLPADDGGGNCAGLGCHQNGEFRGVVLTDKPRQAYDFLKSYQGGQQSFYLGSDDSWILCNLQPKNAAGGVTMPPGASLPDSAFKLVKTWAQCGQLYKTQQEEIDFPNDP